MPISKDKKKISGEIGGVLPNNKKLDLAFLFPGQRRTLVSNQPSKLSSLKGTSYMLSTE